MVSIGKKSKSTEVPASPPAYLYQSKGGTVEIMLTARDCRKDGVRLRSMFVFASSCFGGLPASRITRHEASRAVTLLYPGQS